jgi:hypothetical protein
MDAATAGLLGTVIGAAIGAGVGIASAILTNRHQRELERVRSRNELSKIMKEELIAHVAKAAQAMLSAQHSMEWMCWLGLQGPGAIDEQVASRYQQEIHATFPELLGALAVVASHDKRLYNDLARLAEQIYPIDDQIGSALVQYQDAPERVAEILAEISPNATNLYKSLPLQLAAIMESARNRIYSSQ